MQVGFFRRLAAMLVGACLLFAARFAAAQSFGVELQNTLMPAAGGMAGTSIAAPQDVTSAVNGNPASLVQFTGTQFSFGGAWAEPTYNLTQTGPIPQTGTPDIEPFHAKSTAPGTPLGNIGITQDLSAMGLPATIGLGFVSTAGGLVDFRQIPESNGTNSGIVVFNLPVTLGMAVTERLAVGAGISTGIAFFDGPFVGASGMTPDYALRGVLGANYMLTDTTILGGYYQTEQKFRFDNAVVLNPGIGQTNFDVTMDLPQNIGFGLANRGLIDGCLLIAVDVTYKFWNQSAMYGAIYNNQWVAQLGAQYSTGNYRLRAGYAWAQNPIDPTPGQNIGGFNPGDLPAVRYTQGLLAITNPHRISAGIGRVDVIPGLDMDLFAGGMFRSSQDLGQFTSTNCTSYWVGLGLTWRFGCGGTTQCEMPCGYGL